MEHNPKGTVFVLSDNDPSRASISNALQGLGLTMEYSNIGRISPSHKWKTHAVVLVSDGCDAPALEEANRRMHDDKRARNEERANDYRC